MSRHREEEPESLYVRFVLQPGQQRQNAIIAPSRIRRWALPDPATGASGPTQGGTATAPSAHALLAIAAARPPPPGPDVGSAPVGQRAAWHDTGRLPATADDDPPGREPGLVKVSASEARRLARLATQPMTIAAR
jgi:hypothetical protein